MLINTIYSFFIPDSLRSAEDDDYYEAKTVVLVSISIAVIILMFFANRVRLSGLLSLPALILGFAAIAVIAVPFVLKYTNSLSGSTISLILVLMGLIMALTYITGGPLSPSLVFIPAFPMGSIMFVSFRFGIYISVIFFFYVLFLLWAQLTGNIPDPSLSISSLSILHITCTIATAVVFGVLGGLHLSWQSSMRALLQKASDTKSEFLSGMSHELRTPLNSIMGFSDLLTAGMAGNVNQKQEEYLRNILDSSKHMLRLVNDLLDIAKIESGEIELNAEVADLDGILAETLQMVREPALSRHIEIEFSQHDNIKNQFAYLDIMKFKQILLNLLSNAVKFSPEHSIIKMNAGLEDDNIVITITDEGDGIPSEMAEQIFQKFYQVNNDLTNKSVGTGLGLPISRMFAELHNGNLRLQEHDSDRGACFVLTIPFLTIES